MPTSEARAVNRYRASQLALEARTIRAYGKLWSELDRERMTTAFPAWSRTVAELIAEQRAQSVEDSATFLEAMRAAAGIRGAAVVVSAEAAPVDQVRTSLVATVPAAYFASVKAGNSVDTALDAARVMSTGAVTRLVLDAGRETVTRSAVADPKARGWRRIVSPGSDCPFCTMLANRGAVYSRDTVAFGAHDHCSCVAAPAYGNRTVAVDDYAPSPRNVSDADRARVRRWMADNGY